MARRLEHLDALRDIAAMAVVPSTSFICFEHSLTARVVHGSDSSRLSVVFGN